VKNLFRRSVTEEVNLRAELEGYLLCTTKRGDTIHLHLLARRAGFSNLLKCNTDIDSLKELHKALGEMIEEHTK
jgi:hypothetical protein